MNRSKLPDFADRLSTANEARKAQLERAKALAERPEGAERRKEREAIVAARNLRIDEHKAAEAARKEREAADRAAAEAAEATAISACRKIVRLVRPMPPAVQGLRDAARGLPGNGHPGRDPPHAPPPRPS